LRDEFKSLLEMSLPVRRRINEIVTEALDEDDKEYLERWNTGRLVDKMQRIAPGAGITEDEVKANFWAYRVMGALGVYDERFKEVYTRLVGSRIESFMPKYGQLLTDNGIRNNAAPGGKAVIPFDFNSIKRGLRQMDEAAILGLYLFHNALGIFDTDEKVREAVDGLRKAHTPDEDPDYFTAFVFSNLHEQETLAGFRTQEMLSCAEELEGYLQNEGKMPLPLYHQFRCAFEEIDLHQSAAEFMVRNYPGVLLGEDAADSDKMKELGYIADFVARNSFMNRSRMMFSPIFQADSQYRQMLDGLRERD
ncbi:hypothetical protein HZB90_04830, partial [archaeon]|nr:hypothetical protein [archaeon]